MAETLPPAWLNQEYLEKALRHGSKDSDVSIVSFEIKPATVAGDHYASEMYRITMNIRRRNQIENISVIVKTLPTASGELNKIIEKSDVFPRETEAFSKVMPAMKDLLDEVYTEKVQLFGAKYIHSTTKPEPIAIVLEDLKRSGFKLAEVNLGLDLKHSLLVMKTIARYHATSLVLHHKNPHFFYTFKKDTVFSDANSEVIDLFVGSTLRAFAEEVNSWPDCKENYSNIAKRIAAESAITWPNQVKRNDAGFNVLAHGDLWLNNMMFKYSEETGEVQEVRFVDYQLTYWTSPAVDLHYFMNSSVSPDVLQNRHLLMKEYYTTLCETISRLGYGNLQPTLKVFNDEIESRGLFGVMAAIVIRTVALSDRNNVPDLNKVFGKEGNIYLSDRYKDAMKALLPLYEKWGWLNN